MGKKTCFMKNQTQNIHICAIFDNYNGHHICIVSWFDVNNVIMHDEEITRRTREGQMEVIGHVATCACATVYTNAMGPPARRRLK